MNYALYILSGLVFVFSVIFFWKIANIIQPNEIGVKIRFGDIIKRVRGLCFTLPWIEWIERYPRNIMTFSMKAPSIITTRGYCEGFEETIEPSIMTVVATVQAQFDDKDKISKEKKSETDNSGQPRIFRTINYAPGNDAVSLYEHLIPYVNDAIRAIGGRMPWRLINQERYKFQLWVVARMTCLDNGYYPLVGKGKKTDPYRFSGVRILPEGKKDNNNYDDNEVEIEVKKHSEDKHDEIRLMYEKGSGLTRDNLRVTSPYMKFGLRRITFTIDDINFDEVEGMNEAISSPEIARLKKAADIKESEGTRKVKINEGEGEAIAREKMLNVITKHPDFEAFKTLSDIGKGDSNWIYEMPKELSGIIGKKLFDFNHPKPNRQKEAGK